jgi:hypothetical protein
MYEVLLNTISLSKTFLTWLEVYWHYCVVSMQRNGRSFIRTSFRRHHVQCVLYEVIHAFWGVLHTFCIRRSDRNSTKMKTIRTRLFAEFSTHNLSGFARKLTLKKYLAPQDSPSIWRWICVDPWPPLGGTEFTLTTALEDDYCCL